MIYFTTFIFTLLLAHIACAVPACGDGASRPSPEDVYNPTYDNEQLILTDCKLPWDPKYDNPKGDTKTLACSDLASRYPRFGDFPSFPYIGAAFDIREPNSPNCGKCWKMTNMITHKTIFFTAVDSAKSGFVLSQHAHDVLNSLNCTIEAVSVDPRFCFDFH